MNARSHSRSFIRRSSGRIESTMTNDGRKIALAATAAPRTPNSL
jgi:hypothetical protein